jgi:hypothetical protein
LILGWIARRFASHPILESDIAFAVQTNLPPIQNAVAATWPVTLFVQTLYLELPIQRSYRGSAPGLQCKLNRMHTRV